MKLNKRKFGMVISALIVTISLNSLNLVAGQPFSTSGETVHAITSKKVSVKLIKLNATSVSIVSGSKYTLKPTISPSNASNKKIYWTTSNSRIATVSNGNISAKKAGTVTITATTADGKKVAKVKVTVKKYVHVASVKLSKTSLTLAQTKKYTLKATVSPSNATNRSVTWATSNAKVATVKDGVVTAVGVGKAIITATTVSGKKVAKTSVTVTPFVHIESVYINAGKLKYTIGDIIEVGTYIEPYNATNPAVMWSSSNTSVATVNNGRIVTKAVGKTVISVTTVDGSKTDTCELEVLPYVSVTGVTLSNIPQTIFTNRKYTFKATVAPSNATNKSVKWTTSNSKIATVSNGVITTKTVGTVTIKAISNNGKIASTTITVKKAPPYPVYKTFILGGGNGYVVGGTYQFDHGELTGKSTVKDFIPEANNIARNYGWGASVSDIKAKTVGKLFNDKYLITDVEFKIFTGFEQGSFDQCEQGYELYKIIHSRGLDTVPSDGLFAVSAVETVLASAEKLDSYRVCKVVIKFKKI